MINNPANIVYHIFRINSELYSELIQKTTQPLTIFIRGVVVQVIVAKNVKQELAKPKLIASYQLMDFLNKKLEILTRYRISGSRRPGSR